MLNLLALDLITTESLAVEPLVLENLFEGFYIKRFFGGWKTSEEGNNVVITNNDNNYYLIKTKTSDIFVI